MPIQLPHAKRYLARRVVCDGREYGLSIVEITDAGVEINAYEKETPSTSYVNGAIIVDTSCNPPKLYVE